MRPGAVQSSAVSAHQATTGQCSAAARPARGRCEHSPYRPASRGSCCNDPTHPSLPRRGCGTRRCAATLSMTQVAYAEPARRTSAPSQPSRPPPGTRCSWSARSPPASRSTSATARRGRSSPGGHPGRRQRQGYHERLRRADMAGEGRQQGEGTVQQRVTVNPAAIPWLLLKTTAMMDVCRRPEVDRPQPVTPLWRVAWSMTKRRAGAG